MLTDAEHAAGVDKTNFPGMQGGPLMHVIAAKAICFKLAMSAEFRAYQKQVVANAKKLAQTMLARGFDVVSNGTDTHLFLLDLTAKGFSGKKAERWLEDAGITVNKNTVPNETQSPFVTSGIRIGTPALTTRGMGEDEMRRIGSWMADVLDAPNDRGNLTAIRDRVREFCLSFPLYRGLLDARRAPVSLAP